VKNVLLKNISAFYKENFSKLGVVVLDVVFHEDYSRVRSDHGPENLALLNRTALSLLKKAPGKESIKSKRKKAGWNNEYLLEVLGSSSK